MLNQSALLVLLGLLVLLVSTYFATATDGIQAKDFFDHRGRVRQLLEKMWLRFEEFCNFIEIFAKDCVVFFSYPLESGKVLA